MQQKLFPLVCCFLGFALAGETASATVSILRPGTYHEGEVSVFEPSGSWLGILKSGDGKFSAKQVTVKMTKVKDQVVGDEDGKTSAVEVTSEADVEFLLRGFAMPANGFPTVELKRESLKPGESMEFVLGEKHAKLSATGLLKKQGDQDIITDYRWVYEVDGKSQLIAETKGFDDREFKVLWVGDLNNDGLPDVIADTSDHYNQSQIELFVSQKMGKEPLKSAATLTSVGC